MAKQALLDVLEQTIGKYVKDLDAENLNLGIWNGQVELNSLELNVDAVNAELERQAEDAPNLSLPFRVNRGSFGSFQIDVPWSRLMSQPVVLRAHGLNVSVEVYERHVAASSPILRDDNDLKRQKKILEARIKSILAANESRLRKKAVAELANLDNMESSKNGTSGSSFSSRLVRRIIENIQVEVNDVHISLESGESTAGIVMESLTLFTTDARGKRSFVDRTSGDQRLSNSFLHKALQIQGLGIYLDEDKDIFHSIKSIEEVAIGPSAPVHSFILAPLSFETTLRQADSNACIDYPKYLLTSKLPALSVILSKSQLEFTAQIAEQINPSGQSIKPLFPEYRPLRRVSKETAKEWWQYAYRCVGRLNGQRGWKDFFLAFKRRKLYIQLYKRDAHSSDCHWLEPLSAKELRQLHEIESDRAVSIDGIMAWRNIGDAQFDKEQDKYDATIRAQKAKQKKARSFFFGTTNETVSENPADLPPITLSAEEMKELETINLNQMTAQELSKDSKFCNIHFVLGSFRINLTSYDMRQVAALNMGRVSSAFKANADGSFVFGIKVSSLDIMDMVTPQSLYPNVLGSLRKETSMGELDDIFSLNVAKTKDGDQTLSAKLVSFQAVASPILLKEMKKFFTLGPTRHRHRSVRNPMLAKSLSGSVDLFYDANDGGMEAPPVESPEVDKEEEAGPSTSAAFSNALIEAWKSKTETKASWVVDLDIRAPILVLPQNCVDDKANVLVLDLGHLRFQYGSIEEAAKIQTWFKNHPKSSDDIDPIVDNGKVGITNLQFMVTETASWHESVAKQGSPDAPFESEAVVEPISINFDFAIESVAASEIPRGCAIGVVPSIVLRLSPTQASRALNVYTAWKRLIKESKENSLENPQTAAGNQSKETEALSKSHEVDKQRFLTRPEQSEGEAVFSIFHVSVWLQRLSVVVDFEDDGGVDAHLVSANATMSSMSNGSSITNLSMGWFWILDRFQRSYARKQRLVVHSSLPLEPHLFAADEKYAILDELEKLGVFKERTSKDSELANITYKSFALPSLDDSQLDSQFTSEDAFSGMESARVDAKFSSLYIHWNPQAVKTLTSMLGKFKSFLESSKSENDDPLLIVSAGSVPSKPRQRLLSGEKTNRAREAGKKLRGELFVINAEMKGFDVYLNSARDDLPLFILHMSRAKVQTLASAEGDLLVALALGDLRLATPNTGETQADYRTLLGLAPGRTESLLCVKYYSGPKAMQGAVLNAEGNVAQCKAFCDVELSPMRMVYLHAHVMTLVEYATEGILGALFAQAASSAVAVAADIANANASDSTKQYHIRATAFDFVLPQSARNTKYISLHAGELEVVYTSFSDPGGGEAIVALSDVSLQDSTGDKLQEDTIRVDVSVKLPPIGVGSVEEQTMRVDLALSSAAFLLSKSQYGQIMLTVDNNIGDYELYLRDEVPDQENGNATIEAAPSSDSESDRIQIGPLTHAGVAEVIIPRRMDVQIKIKVLSIELFSDQNRPLIRAAAVNANIVYLSLFDQQKKVIDVTLGNLMCDDQRPRAVKRQYQSLIYQAERESADDTSRSSSVQDVFQIKYESMENGDTNYDLIIGSPRIVFVPDVVSEVMDFITVEGRAAKTEMPSLAPTTTDNTDGTDVHVDNENLTVGMDEGAVEVSLQQSLHAAQVPVSKMSLNIATSRCSLVLVDLGGDLSSIGSPHATKAQQGNQVIENLVMEGRTNASLNFASDKHTGETTSLELNAHGDNIEIYTAFGRDMRSPLQILEPAEFSVVLTNTTQRFELRAAALTPFNITFSMRNYALISALLGGMGYGKEQSSGEAEELSAVDELRIEKLAKKLEGRVDESTLHMSSANSLRVSESFFRADTETGTKSNLSYAVSIKLTLPEANLTVVNDLQGLDDALFRITVVTFVAGGELRKWLSPTPGAPPLTTFDCHVHTSVMADYFDSSVNLWKKLLTKSWELSLRGARGASKRFQSERLSTTFDIESFPCCLSFSEQFLVSIAAASRMWSIYSVATSSTASLLKQVNIGDAHDSIAERGAASSAARNLITSLPYALENHFGIDVDFKLPGKRASVRQCPSGTIQYFRFEPPARLGFGGERLYGQEVLYKKSLELYIGDAVVTIDDLDDEVGKPRRAHNVGLIVLFTSIEKEGKTKVLHLSSSVNMVNSTSIPFHISLLKPPTWEDVGICEGGSSMSAKSGTSFSPGGTSSVQDGILTKPSKNFGIPVHHLDAFMFSWREDGRVDTVMKITPKFSDWAYEDHAEVHGRLELHAVQDFLLSEESNSITTKFDVLCRPDPTTANGRRANAFVFRAHAQLSLVDGVHLFIDVSFEPRAVIVNNMPISLSLRTPMPHTTSDLCQHDPSETIHELAPGSKIEIFTPGPSIAVNMKCADMPIAGTPMGWMETFVDLALSPEFGMSEPLRCVFPFDRKNKSNLKSGGCEFFVADGTTDFSSFFNDVAAGEMQKRASTAQSYGLEVMAALSDADSQRTFFVTICNYAVDHTGTILVERFFGTDPQRPPPPSVPYSTFASPLHRRRITLLPRSTIPFRLLHLTMEGDEGIRSTVPFKIDNVAITQGGVGSTMIPWEDNTPSGYFAYRKLVTTDQSELHIIPEYVVYNGSDQHSILVRQPGFADIVVPPGTIKPVWIQNRDAGLILSLEYMEIGGFTPPLRVDNLGLRVAVLKSFQGHPLGSIAIQTVIGAKDSRFVVKIGGIKRGMLDSSGSSGANTIIDLKRDFLRFRIQASELEVTLNEYKWAERPATKGPLASPDKRRLLKEHETAVCTFLLQRFTVDWQRVFKDEDAAKSAKNLRRSVLLSPERSQLSVVIYSILIKDERPQTVYPVVFNSTSRASFLDLCVRIRGPMDSDLIKVDLVDLNLAHAENSTHTMYLHTSEDFLWKLLDVADRINGATAELASEGMQLKWDVEHGGYVVAFDDSGAADETAAHYAPPRTGSIYDVNRARVSPFILNVSFKRNPQATRYSNQNVQGGAIVKYFTQRLKFTIDDAELNFGVYETNNLKGPSDRLVEVLQAVYMSRMKLKLVSIMTAASFQDWKTLANRKIGGDNFMEGDLVRVAGNLAGKTANMVFKGVGKGMGKGVFRASHAVGNTFEHATAKVGARSVGAGVNSILSGVGGGVGDGISGVGTGAGKLVQGVGKGTGQVIGGVTGGMLMAGKGIGQGITRGDGKALVSGVAQGLNSVGCGVGQGVGTAVTGAADGFLSVGKGLFSGVKTVGKGFGGAFTGKREDKKRDDEHRRNSKR